MYLVKYVAVFVRSGDITDAKLEDREGSRQFEDEWKQYDRVLRETGVLDKTVWLDTRGNHGLCTSHAIVDLVAIFIFFDYICGKIWKRGQVAEWRSPKKAKCRGRRVEGSHSICLVGTVCVFHSIY